MVGFFPAAGLSQRLIEVPVASTRINVSETARDLGAVKESQLSLSAQVAAVCPSYHAATAAPTARPIHVNRDRKDAGPGVHFLSSRLLQLTVLRHRRRCNEPAVQSVQNADARLVSGARRYDHITPVLQDLHWLPVRRRVDFKMATLVYPSLSVMAPAWPPTVSWSPTKVVVSCVLPHQGRAS